MTQTRSKATLHFGTFCPEVSGFGVQLQQAIFHGGSREKCAFGGHFVATEALLAV